MDNRPGLERVIEEPEPEHARGVSLRFPYRRPLTAETGRFRVYYVQSRRRCESRSTSSFEFDIPANIGEDERFTGTRVTEGRERGRMKKLVAAVSVSRHYGWHPA